VYEPRATLPAPIGIIDNMTDKVYAGDENITYEKAKTK